MPPSPSASRPESRVVVTGLGLVSAAGAGVESAWAHLLSGETALSNIRSFDPAPWGLEVAGEAQSVPRVDGEDRALQLLRLATDEVLRDAGWSTEPEPRRGVVLGTCQGAIEPVRALHRRYLNRPVRADAGDHGLFAAYRPGEGTARAAEQVGARGPRATVGMVCVSSAVAILHGMSWLRRGVADQVLVGGFEGFSPFVFTGFQCIGALARGALRPFDLQRDGTVLGEGAALLALETLESAQRRGARVRAELLGGGVSADAFHMTAPDPQGAGLQRAIRMALKEARLGPADIDYISAHGTGTAFNDQMELTAFSHIFGEQLAAGHAPPLSSKKSTFGHTLGAAGALDALLSVMALERDLLPPTVALAEPIGDGRWDFVPGRARPVEAPLRHILSTNSAFGGNNSALVLARWGEA